MIGRKFFLAVLAALFLMTGCATMRLTEAESAMLGNSVGIVDAWSGCVSVRPAVIGCEGSLRKITVVVANPTTQDQKVEIECVFKRSGLLFGKRATKVPAHHKSLVVVYGSAGSVEFSKVSCKLKKTQ
jgi:hypothetical protein